MHQQRCALEELARGPDSRSSPFRFAALCAVRLVRQGASERRNPAVERLALTRLSLVRGPHFQLLNASTGRTVPMLPQTQNPLGTRVTRLGARVSRLPAVESNARLIAAKLRRAACVFPRGAPAAPSRRPAPA